MCWNNLRYLQALFKKSKKCGYMPFEVFDVIISWTVCFGFRFVQKRETNKQKQLEIISIQIMLRGKKWLKRNKPKRASETCPSSCLSPVCFVKHRLLFWKKAFKGQSNLQLPRRPDRSVGHGRGDLLRAEAADLIMGIEGYTGTPLNANPPRKLPALRIINHHCPLIRPSDSHGN